jgi:hypothetical protein
MAATPDMAKRALYDYVCQWWGELDFEADEEDISKKPPEDMDEAIERYFDPESGAGDREYAEATNPMVDPTKGMEAFISSDRFDERHILNINFMEEGLIFDYVNQKTGRVVKTMSVMYDEILEEWLK